MRLRVSAVYPCHCSGIWCSAWAVVSCCVTVAWLFCGRGATLVAARETQRLPALRGSNQAKPPHRPPTSDLQGAHAERSPRLLVLSPFVCRGSRRQWGVSPRTRVSGARAVEDNQSSRLQKPLEPETTKGNRPPCLQKFLDLDPLRATSPRVCNMSFCPRPQRATGPHVYKSISKTGPSGDNQSHRNPDLPV